MNYVEHEGVVDQVAGEKVTVKISNLQGCTSCQAKNACPVPGGNDQAIEVFATRDYKPGDRVIIVGRKSQGLKAAFLAYILPLIIIIMVLILGVRITGSESIAALVSLLVLVPYFLILRATGRVLQRTFSFTIKSVNE